MVLPAVAATRAELRTLLADRTAAPVALVPTMGALHEGHAGLMRVARDRVGDGPVVASIFVNPLQFGAGEDLERYPRTLDADLAVCGREGVDLVFAPSVEEVYPGGVPSEPTTESVTIDPGPLAAVLEGKTRPGHFRGVLTVVAKLFGLVRPDVAVFGEKDYQQLALIRRMVADLCLGIEVAGAPTLRESDGLALSSRNRYLSPEEHREATTLSRALYAAQRDAEYGVGPALDAARAEIRTSDAVDLDYLVITDPDLTPLPDGTAISEQGTEARILVAARIGATRLIDNMALTLGRPSTGSEDV